MILEVPTGIHGPEKPRATSKSWIRILIVLAAAAWGVTIVLTAGTRIYQPLTHFTRDFDQVHFAALAMRDGLNPYSVVGPGRLFEWPWLLYYPLPAMVVALPFTVAPVLAARAAFFGLSSALLAYVLTRDGYHRLVVFASMAYLYSGVLAQWEVLLTASALLPFAGFVLAAKPNIGLALLAAYPSLKTIVGVLMIVVVTLFIVPTWPAEWLTLVRSTSDMDPLIMYPGGLFLLLALLRWRRPEARLIAVLACIPHTTMPYALIPLFLIPASLTEGLILAWSTWLAKTVVDLSFHHASYSEFISNSTTVAVPLVYLPALVMVLRRPNEGELPAWLVKSAQALIPGRRGRNNAVPNGTSHAGEGTRE
ncbi:MAG: hypothetical protein ACR2G6_17980 [Gemmatimonadaceae bacterium]